MFRYLSKKAGVFFKTSEFGIAKQILKGTVAEYFLANRGFSPDLSIPIKNQDNYVKSLGDAIDRVIDYKKYLKLTPAEQKEFRAEIALALSKKCSEFTSIMSISQDEGTGWKSSSQKERGISENISRYQEDGYGFSGADVTNSYSLPDDLFKDKKLLCQLILNATSNKNLLNSYGKFLNGDGTLLHEIGLFSFTNTPLCHLIAEYAAENTQEQKSSTQLK